MIEYKRYEIYIFKFKILEQFLKFFILIFEI